MWDLGLLTGSMHKMQSVEVCACACVCGGGGRREGVKERRRDRGRQTEQALEPRFLEAHHFTCLLYLLNSHSEAIDFTDHSHWYPTKTNYKLIKPSMAIKHMDVYYLMWSLQPPFHKCRQTLINLSMPWDRNFSVSALKKKKSSYHGKHCLVQNQWKCQKL